MFPYKSFFERHPELGYSLLIVSIIGIPFCFKYSKWLETQERMYEAHLHTVNILEFFNLFIENYKNLGGLDGTIFYEPVDKEGNYSYGILGIGWMILAGEMCIYMKFKFESGKKESFGLDITESGIKKGLTYVFDMNKREAGIVWDRLKRDIKQIRGKWIQGPHNKQLEPVQYVPEEQISEPLPEITSRNTHKGFYLY